MSCRPIDLKQTRVWCTDRHTASRESRGTLRASVTHTTSSSGRVRTRVPTPLATRIWTAPMAASSGRLTNQRGFNAWAMSNPRIAAATSQNTSEETEHLLRRKGLRDRCRCAAPAGAGPRQRSAPGQCLGVTDPCTGPAPCPWSCSANRCSRAAGRCGGR